MTVQMQGGLDIQRLCGLSGVSRAGFYRYRQERVPAQADTELRDTIQKLSLKHRHYGYRRMTAQLRRDGTPVNAKRVLRLMREDNLLCMRGRPYVPRTTNSRHGYRILPNLVRGLVPSGIDQIWVADITYIRLLEAFVYLAVILDAFSRRVVGWALEDHLQTRLALAALDMAIAARGPQAGRLIHHSDRGVQYACSDYASRLDHHGIRMSMSGVANPYDNAKAESFMKTLKAEEVDGKTYLTLDHARRDIATFLETTYNRERLHSALGYQPPVEFESDLNRHHVP
ncbi:IS2 transposase TnpB [bacterium YEK0313]|nr:IS2 transposase TnpB [bacterium YEK0313]CEJ11515.1 IS2 transposase TnpB [bacterium YEK0313]CEJ15795.1 IS2 transposase TnpB [bacterium YEK0313]